MSEGVRGARRIAVLRANGIGDFVFALPALDALRAAHPSAEIVLLGLPWHERFLAGRPGPIDRVEVVPAWPGVRDDEPADRAAQRAFFRRMVAERFDLALQLHGGGRNSNPFVRRLGARRTIGLQAEDAAPLDATVPYRYFQSEVQRCLEVAATAGAVPRGIQPHLCVTPDDFAEAENVLGGGGRPIVVLNPGAGDGRRRWPVEKFAEVGVRLSREGARVVITGAAEDAPLATALRDALPAAEDLTGRLSLGGLLGVLARAAVVVSNDTGPLHLAAAVGVPTVGIYWCGNVINAGAATRTRHRVLMSWRLECPDCGADCMRVRCPHDGSFVADVPTSEVAAEALDLLAHARLTAGPPVPAPPSAGVSSNL